MNRILKLSLLRFPLRRASIFELQKTSFEVPTSVKGIERSLWTTPLCEGKLKKMKKEWEKKIINEKLSSLQEENEDDDEEVDDGLPKDYKEKSFHLASRRIDTLLNRAIKKSSSEVEKMILSGKVRVNNEKVPKKAYNINKGDEIDIFMSNFAENEELIQINRIYINDYIIEENGYHIKVKFWKQMLVPKW